MKKIKKLEKALDKAVEKECRNLDEAAVMFSGGLDSSIIAKKLAGKTRATAFAVGVKGAPALERAGKAAELLNINLVKVLVEKEKIPLLLEEAREVTGIEKDFVKLSIAVPELAGFNAVSKYGFKDVFMGQGADELFFGYDFFRKDSSKERRKKALADLEEQRPMEGKLAEKAWVKLHYPFLDEDFVENAMEFTAEENLEGKKDLLRKRVLRKLAVKIGIPGKIAFERKKAMQYDSRIARELKKLF